MGAFFIDDSVHRRAGFIVCAIVYTGRGVTGRVKAALRGAGLRPGTDEFKSGAIMQGKPHLAELREHLSEIIHSSCRVGLVVTPLSDRPQLGASVLDGLAWILRANKLVRRRGRIFSDTGFFTSAASGSAAALTRPELTGKVLHPEQDSRRVVGIQLADLAAHTCATMLLDQLGHVTKKVKAGDNSGYDPDWDLELGFKLWATIRYAFFTRRDPERAWDYAVADATPSLYIAPSCSESLRDAAVARFGQVYLGCIH